MISGEDFNAGARIAEVAEVLAIKIRIRGMELERENG